MTSAAILFSGNNYNKIQLFARFLKLRIVSSTSFNLIQRTYLVPSVDEHWAEHQTEVLSEFEGKEVTILGIIIDEYPYTYMTVLFCCFRNITTLFYLLNKLRVDS